MTADYFATLYEGLLLSETKYRYQIEADIAPFRGLLLGFFFITVGFSIDIRLLFQEGPKILLMLFGLIAGKATIITLLSMLWGVSFSSAQHTGLLNSQGGKHYNHCDCLTSHSISRRIRVCRVWNRREDGLSSAAPDEAVADHSGPFHGSYSDARRVRVGDISQSRAENGIYALRRAGTL
jgi:hypothetical protein